eukprot:CAMPEP_0185743254 /NCGR_PEP_ID=MMETSP1174-20130828/926_1 /TAXON_ID=35687 /ORGANISM="Dictyocha speculum, Strain CCMP1381" /LENGTH=988 /DNA_ID=CAMNT_0028415799 /DNA_START=33 /DNA_END=2999 /DNA_ORIENTATION=+
MPLRLEIKKKLQARSDRVKCVDIHPVENWVLAALYSGNVFLWDYETCNQIKNFDVCELPVRSARFIVRKQWFITASDDMHLRIFNYNTMEKIKEFEAHADYIRYVEVHPSQPFIISAADDMTMKLWNWEKSWECTQIFEGHAHYVMMVKFNLKDTNTFASASLDRTIKVWGLGAATPHFSLEGHDRGVNCVDYYPGGDKPYLLSGADDNMVKIWDYQTKACVQTLDGHANNVCAVLFHPRLPIIISGSEDGTVRIWHTTTYRAETTLNYGMERAWSLSSTRDANKLAIGYDEGTVVLKLGNEMPVASMDSHTGKLVYAQTSDIVTATLKGISEKVEAEGIADGERLPLSPKDLGSTEIFPQCIKHNCNGRFIVVCGDGEYIIYTSQALRNKSFGSALDFVWSGLGTGDFAIRESISRVKTFKNFKEHKTIKAPVSSAEGIFGGQCLAIKGSDCIVFYDWAEGIFIRKIDVAPKDVHWNDSGELCLLVCEDTCYVLRFDAAAVAKAIEDDTFNAEEGVEGAFELTHELADKVATGEWVGDCFIYTNAASRLNYFVGGEIMTLCHLDHTMYMLGYLSKEDRVFLVDKALNVLSFKVLKPVLDFQTAIVRGDLDEATEILKDVPESEHSSVARFLESQGLKEHALEVSQDPDQRFDLALELDKLEIGHEILVNLPEADKDTTDAQAKWKRLGDLALAKGHMTLAEECAKAAGDTAGLLLLYTCTGNAAGTQALAEQARVQGKTNVAFLAMFLLGHIEDCVSLLKDTGRLPEAAFLARTYMPSEVSSIVESWKKDLSTVSERAAKALADPAEYPLLFTDLTWALKVEEHFKANRGALPPAADYPNASKDLEFDLIELFKTQAAALQLQEEKQAAPPSPPSATEEQEEETARLEAERLVVEDATRKANLEKEAAERAAAERAAAEKATADKAAAEKAAAEQAAAEQAAAEQAAAEKAAAEQAAAEKAAAEKAAADKAADEDFDEILEEEGEDW